MPLTDVTIRAAKPKEKAYKLFDERGLFLLVKPNGARLWRFKYSHGGREKLISLGDYQDVTLKRARDKRDEARRLLADGVDPSAQRQEQRAALGDTLTGIAEEFFERQAKKLAATTVDKDLQRLRTYILPSLGRRPIRSITAPELLLALRRIEARGTHETAHRTRSAVGRVMRYAIATGRAERDVAADLRGALTPVTETHHAAVTEPKRIAELLRAIDGYVGQPATAYALKLAPLVFVRPGELRGAEWSEFDLEAKEPEWRIRAERMKMGQEHIVPLSTQAVELLRDLHALTGDGLYLFPGLRSASRPISNNTLNAALRRIGFSQDEHTAHGFRSMASTRLNEMGFPPDVIELQLAHAERDEVRRAYNRATRLAERRRMMQAWADYLDELKAGAKVIPLHGKRA
jgi:integrase